MTIVLDKVVEDVASKAVNELVQIVAKNIKLVVGIDSEIIDLTSEIETFNARLVDASKIPRAKELQVMKVIVKKFRAVVNEAQDAVAKYIAEKKNHEDKTFTKCLDKIPHFGKVNVCASEIQSIRTKVNAILKTHEKDLLFVMKYPNNGQNNDQPHFQARPVVEKNKVWGFEDDLKIIKDRISEASNKFNVISIVGMAGTGKTTFATKLFDDQEVINKFVLCIWVHVSQNFNGKQKFIDILHQIKKRTQDFSMISEDLLKNEINQLLKDQKYFVVLDDVWNKEDWNSLKDAFPENSNGSRVLVTTRYNGVVDSVWESHTLKKLNPEESWLLLKTNVFGEEQCSNESFEKYGRKIATKCNGLPLALGVIAGVLIKNRIIGDWERVAENPFLEINREGQSYHKLVMLSYDHLPNEKLKNCFLYFASFPMGYEIAAWKLIRLWIAEEFIPTIDEWGYALDVEVESQKYLNDLVDRNLVMVMKKRTDGQIKTCRIHDSLHEFCKSEAARKNLFYVMDGGQRLDANNTSSRRLCFYSSITNIFDAEKKSSRSFFSIYNKKRNQYPFGKQVHSLLLSSSEKNEIRLKQEQLATFSNTFPLIRVLDIESLKFESLPDEIYDLHLLRYLAITVDLDLLPRQFRKLRELEILVFRTTKHMLKIDGGIWNMEKLRHVHTNTSMQLPFVPKNSFGSTEIRTLCTISPASCTEDIFSKTPKLQKLGVRGDLAELVEEKEEICLFNNLKRLDGLENLKLHGQSEQVLKVPKLDNFPRKLRKLTLSNTLFEWNDMDVLGLLEELEVLKLDEKAFMGKLWHLNNDVFFKQLQYLRIGRTNLETWKVEKNNFPVLESLVLRNCTSLEEIPDAFADVHSLIAMELYHVSERAVNSAREVYNLRHSKKDVKTKGFDLFITSLPSQATGHEQTHGEENVSTSGFDLSGSSIPPQPTAHEQTHGEENVNTSGFNPSNSSVPSPPSKIKMPPVVEEENVVGFDNEVKIIKDRIFGDSMNLTVISIVGMIGVGKTTFATMLFKDLDLQYEFFTRLWVYVSSACNRKQIFHNILRQFTKQTDDFKYMSDEKLADRIKEYLNGGKYFIVLDDIRAKDDWDCLKIAFPNNMKGSRILVTTRHASVASYVDSTHIPHQLKFLRDDESWDLIEKKVFRGAACPTELISYSRSIAEKINGLPLAAVMIAAVLLFSQYKPANWKNLARDPFELINDKNHYHYKLLKESIYDEMDSQLKDYFLYLAAFPRRLEIDAGKLMHLWMAEGFISEGDLEYTAEKYLKEFVEMNLLTVSKRRADGKIKTVSIHEMLHVCCIREAANLNFFREFDGFRGASNSTTGYRRLFVHSSILQDISEVIKSSSEDVQSFLSFSSEPIEIPKALLATIPNAFPNLKVLDIRSLKFPQLPKEFYRLTHLTYLGISTHLKLLPKEFGSFSELQTLVFHTTQTALKIEADIWSMPKLRHVLTNTSAHLPSPIRRSKKSSGSAYITTLSTIPPTSCTGEILDKARNLQKLGIRGNLVELMEGKKGISLFDNLQKLRYLENLKLLHDTIDGQANVLRSVPRADKFPPRLRKLTLSNTSFEWKDFCVLGALNELEVLKLDENSFKGELWNLNSVVVFKQLQYLRIGRTNLAHWMTSKSCFPVLTMLVIRHCASLTAVPSDFADVYSLELLELYFTNEAAANSARKIEKLKHDRGNAQSSGFKLSIYPPDH